MDLVFRDRALEVPLRSTVMASCMSGMELTWAGSRPNGVTDDVQCYLLVLLKIYGRE